MKKNKIKIPILVYHDIAEHKTKSVSTEEEFYTVNIIEFEKQLDYLRKQGYTPVDLDDLLDTKSASLNLPEKPIILTFDDGKLSNYRLAYPVLSDLGFKAVFFVVGANIGSSGYMSWKQLKEVTGDSITVGSHGLTHRFLTKLTINDLKKELGDSRLIIHDNLKKPIRYLSIPGGLYDCRVKKIAHDCGYQAICTSSFGLNNIDADLFSLRRIAVTHDTGIEQFSQLINPSTKLIVSKNLGACARNLFKNIIGIDNYTAIKESILRRKK